MDLKFSLGQTRNIFKNIVGAKFDKLNMNYKNNVKPQAVFETIARGDFLKIFAVQRTTHYTSLPIEDNGYLCLT